MKIRFGGKAATISIVVGIAAIAYTPVTASITLGHPVFLVSPFMLLGVVMLLGGLLLLRGATYVTVEDHQLVVHAPIGPIKRRFRFASWKDVEYAGGKLWITNDGNRKLVPLHRAQANPADWQAFEKLLGEKTFE